MPTAGCTVVAWSRLLQELIWFCFNLNFDTAIVQKLMILEINMKHQVALSNKKLEWLFILRGKIKEKGRGIMDKKSSPNCVTVASPCLSVGARLSNGRIRICV